MFEQRSDPGAVRDTRVELRVAPVSKPDWNRIGTYAKPLASVPAWPLEFLTTTSILPAAWAGVTAWICVALLTVTPVAAPQESPSRRTGSSFPLSSLVFRPPRPQFLGLGAAPVRPLQAQRKKGSGREAATAAQVRGLIPLLLNLLFFY